MKLATYADGSRDGHLVVVAADLETAHYAAPGASRLQALLDDWNFLSPQLEDLAATLDGGRARHAMAFDPALARAPLARPPRCVRISTGGSPVGTASAEPAAPVPAPPNDGPFAGRTCVEEAAWFAGARLLGEPRGAGWAWQPHLVIVTADVPWGADAGRATEAIRLMGWAVRVGARMAEPDPQPAAGGAWHFAPLLTTPSAVAVVEPGWTWRLTPVTAAGPQRLPRGARDRDRAGDAEMPSRAVLGDALAEAARRAPLPAGTVMLLPLAEPVIEAELSDGALGWSLALVDPRGDVPLGEVVFSTRGAESPAPG